MNGRNPAVGRALRFVLIIGVLSFFADFTYEGSRSVIGPFLGSLGATAFMIATVTGFGELLGYVLRLGSGRAADGTQLYWPITIAGYVIEMGSVPALALAGNWPTAAILIVLERVGKGIRNPQRDAMLSHAGKQLGGYGWAFGLHEAFDQFGATVGPLVVAAILAHRNEFRLAFAALLIPAGINLCLVILARWLYPRPQDLIANPRNLQGVGLPHLLDLPCWRRPCRRRVRRLSLNCFSSHPCPIAFGETIAVFYAVAMAVSGCGSLALGRLFDRFGFRSWWYLPSHVPRSPHSCSWADIGPHSSASQFGALAWASKNPSFQQRLRP